MRVVDRRESGGHFNVREHSQRLANARHLERNGPSDDQGAAMLSASVAEYDIADVRFLFGEERS